MKKINEKYVKRVNRQLRLLHVYAYEWKYKFIKFPSHDYHQVLEMFERYMHHDIRINWDMWDNKK